MTFSIVARDDRSGRLGVAVQSHYFGVGSLVSWAEAGVGAVATQSVVEPAYGPRGLALMRAGVSAPAALHGVALAAGGREDEARPLLEQAYCETDGWRELLRRLPAAGLFPDDRELLDRLA